MAGPDDDAFAETIAPVSELGDTIVPGRPASASPAAGPRPLAEVPLDHFRVGKEVARGGMGKIVAADDTRLARPVALKVLLDPAGDQLERFQREALITA